MCLLIVVDDLRPELGCYVDEHSQFNPNIQTPNIDNLAAKSLLLRRAYVQVAVCSPSRTSFLTSKRPDTIHVYDLAAYFRTVGGNFTTIPQHFKEHGYVSIGIGKIFHPGSACNFDDDRISWSESNYHAPNPGFWDVKNFSHRAVARTKYTHKPWPDMQITDYAVNVLKKLSNKEKPFFLGIGFHRPNLPFIVPENFVNLYSQSKVPTPENMYAPVNMPNVAWFYYGEMRRYEDIRVRKFSGKVNTSLPSDLVNDLRRHYFASVSYIDSLVGKVLKVIVHLQ